MQRSTHSFGIFAAAALVLGSFLAPTPALSAWEPNRPIEFIVPAGTGGGADIMARTIQGIVTKHSLTKQPMVVINKAGGAGGEGFLDVKGSQGNPHKIIITLSNLFTTPLGHRHSLQLEGSDPGRHAGARRVRALGERREALQEREGIYRRRQGRERHVQDGRHRLQAGRPDHYRGASQKATGAKFIYIPQAAAVRSPCSSSAITSTPPSTTRTRRSRIGAAASCVRSASSTPSRSTTTRRSQATGLGQRSDLQVGGPRHRVSHAARHLHEPGRHQGPGRLLCRPVQEGARDARSGRS